MDFVDAGLLFYSCYYKYGYIYLLSKEFVWKV